MLGVGRFGPVGRSEAPAAGGGPTSAGWVEAADAADAADSVPPTVDPAGWTGDERDAWVVLGGVHGIGPVSFARLLGAFGSATTVLEIARMPRAVPALVDASRGPDGASPAVSPEVATAIVAAARDLRGRLAAVRRSGVGILTLADAAYPRRLRAIELPPPVLFILGDVAALDPERAIAVVGTRRPTEAGRALAGRIAETISVLGATVVSGLAFGIDAAAHAAAIRTETPTVAVIGGGHENLYPASHRGLARAIVRGGGAVISEFAPDVIPSKGTFPRRNRIISGLTDATIVVEAGLRSGALTTAAWALEQGRALHIVPGRIGDPSVAGSLAFLREAAPEARIVAGIPELIEDLGLVRETPRVSTGGSRRPAGLEAVLATLGPVERSIARLVARGQGTVDELVAATGTRGATVLGALTALEVRGLVVEAFGSYRASGALAATADSARPVAPRPRVNRDAA